MRGRWGVVPVLALMVAACGGSAATGDPGVGSGSGSAAPTAGATAPSGGDAPVMVTVDGVAFGYDIGTCDVSADSVRTNAGRSDGSFAFADISWSPDPSTALFHVVATTGEPPAPFELYADVNRSETTWDVTVDGTTAVVQGRMRNELPAAQGNPDLEYYDVTIAIRCDERGFGGMAPEATEDPGTASEDPGPTTASEASITVQLGDTTYQFSYLGCPMTEPAISLVVVDASLNRLFVSAGEAVLGLPDGTQWRAQEVDFDVAGSRATWSGTMTVPAGSEPASITIACG